MAEPRLPAIDIIVTKFEIGSLKLITHPTSWFKDERTRKGISEFAALEYAAMAWPEGGNTELLTLGKLIAWVYQSPDYQTAVTNLQDEVCYLE